MSNINNFARRSRKILIVDDELYNTRVLKLKIDNTQRRWVNEMNNASLVEKPISPNHLFTLVEDC